jgi:HPt (histidine-containing phosphotransfer) domain-containing protein
MNAVHALKSASANIGATDISNDLAELELLSRENHLEAILTRIKPIHDKLNLLVENIYNSVGNQNNELYQNIQFNKIEIDNLIILKNYLLEKDISNIDIIMSKLYDISTNCNLIQALDQISSLNLIYEFKNSIDIINDLLMDYDV